MVMSSSPWVGCGAAGSSCSSSSWLGSSLMWASKISCSSMPPSTNCLEAVDGGRDRTTGSLDTGLDVAALVGFLLGFSWLWWEWVNMFV